MADIPSFAVPALRAASNTGAFLLACTS